MKVINKIVIAIVVMLGLGVWIMAQQPVAQGPQASNAAAWLVTQAPGPGSTLATSACDVSATSATNCKASGGNVYGWFGFNPNATTCYLQFYNSVSPSLGTGVLHPFGVVAGGSFNVPNGAYPWFNNSTAITVAETTTSSGSSQCASPMIVSLFYN